MSKEIPLYFGHSSSPGQLVIAPGVSDAKIRIAPGYARGEVDFTGLPVFRGLTFSDGFALACVCADWQMRRLLSVNSGFGLRSSALQLIADKLLDLSTEFAMQTAATVKSLKPMGFADALAVLAGSDIRTQKDFAADGAMAIAGTEILPTTAAKAADIGDGIGFDGSCSSTADKVVSLSGAALAVVSAINRTCKMRKALSPVGQFVVADVLAALYVVRLLKLSEADPYALNELDGQTLDELAYINLTT